MDSVSQLLSRTWGTTHGKGTPWSPQPPRVEVSQDMYHYIYIYVAYSWWISYKNIFICPKLVLIIHIIHLSLQDVLFIRHLGKNTPQLSKPAFFALLVFFFNWSQQMQITHAASSIITKLGSINRDVNYAQVSWNSIQSMPYSSSGCVLLFIICLCCATESQWDQNGTKKMSECSLPENFFWSQHTCTAHTFTRH